MLKTSYLYTHKGKKLMKRLLTIACLLLIASSITAHNYGKNGICTDAGCNDPYQQPTLVDGWYELSNAGHVEWFSAQVNKGGNNIFLRGRMMCDIDMQGVTHTPIGVSEATKFNGQFDGEHHRILNLKMNSTANLQAFFGGLRGGGTVVRNLILDSSCIIKGGTRVGGIAAFAQTVVEGPIVIENCINEATIIATGNAVGGILGGSMSPHPVIHVRNCLNIGSVTGANETAAIVGWNGDNSESLIAGCLNLGTVNGVDSSNRNMFRYGGAQTVRDNYDMNPPAKASQGIGTQWTTSNPTLSGELCYALNGHSSDGAWHQTLATDKHPLPSDDAFPVFLCGTIDCRGKAVDAYYSNEDKGQTVQPHSFTNGFCTTCGDEDPSAEPRRRKVFIVAGQSNTDGRAALTDYPQEIQDYAVDGARYCYWTYANGIQSMWDMMGGKFQPYRPYTDNGALSRCGFDGVLYNLIEKELQERFYVIKESRGGTAIDTLCNTTGEVWWCADEAWLAHTSPRAGHSLVHELTENIDLCMRNVLDNLEAGYDIECIIWHQGCADRTQPSHYRDNLRTLVNYLRNYLVERTGDERYATLPFLAGSVSPSSTQYSQTVENAKKQLAREMQNFYVINLDDCPLGSDNLHFSASGNSSVARRFFNKMKALGFFEAPTSINSLQGTTHETQGSAIYNLSGQRLSSPQWGVSIVDGKKTLKR